MTIKFSVSKKIANQKQLLQFAKNICEQVKQLRKPGLINIIFVSDREIIKINRTFLNHNYATDVIAFPYSQMKFITPTSSSKTHKTSHTKIVSVLSKNKISLQPFGDIYISVDMAKRESKLRGDLIDQELALYLVHGLLHLSGYDDHAPRKRKIMWTKQKSLFNLLAPNLAPQDFRA